MHHQEAAACQSCGTSYSIQSEMKALQGKYQKLDAQLNHYTGLHSRETALEQRLQAERVRTSDLESVVAINKHKLNEMGRRLQLSQDQLRQADSIRRDIKGFLLNYSSNLRSLEQQLHILRKDCSVSKDRYSTEILNWKNYLQTVEKALLNEIRAATEKQTRQIRDQRAEIEHKHEQLNEANQALRDLQHKYEQSKTTDLEAARHDIATQRNELSHFRQQVFELEQTERRLIKELEQSRQQCEHLEQQLVNNDHTSKDAHRLAEQHRQELLHERELRSKKDAELDDVRSELRHLTQENEQLKSNSKQAERDVQRAMDDVNRSRQIVIDQTRDEHKQILAKYNELDEIHRELIEKRNGELLESQAMRDELDRLRNDQSEWTKQKDKSHVMSDVQMKRLHDDHSAQLQQAEQRADRLQFESNREREQHRAQLSELEHRLQANFNAELNAEKEKYQRLSLKYEHLNDQSRQQSAQKSMPSEEKQSYIKQIDHLEKEKHDLYKELGKLKDALKRSEEQQHRLELENNRPKDSHVNDEPSARAKSSSQTQQLIYELKRDLAQTRTEVSALQETVRKQGDEREQLRDALDEARQHVPATKADRTMPKPLHSSAMAFEGIPHRVAEPLLYPHSQNPSHRKGALSTKPGPSVWDSVVSQDVADPIAQPLSSSRSNPQPSTNLPSIQPHQPAPKNSARGPKKSEQPTENTRRIVRLIKHTR